MNDNSGTVYLLCFSEHFKHARHYIGFTGSDDVEARLLTHAKGQGAKILRAVKIAGLTACPVRLWHDKDRNFERKLKNRKDAKGLCPLCNPGNRQGRE